MGSGDAAPDHSEFCVVSDALALENVSDPLAKVKACVLLLVNALHLQESELLRLSALASLEAGENGLLVESIQIRVSNPFLRMDSIHTSRAEWSSCPAFVLLYPSLCNNDY